MAHAAVEEQQAAWRAEIRTRGRRPQQWQRHHVAVDAMTQTAQLTRDSVAAPDMKAKALRGAKAAEEDPNIGAAARTVANATALIGWRLCNSANVQPFMPPGPTFAPGKGIGGIFASGPGLGPTNSNVPRAAIFRSSWRAGLGLWRPPVLRRSDIFCRP